MLEIERFFRSPDRWHLLWHFLVILFVEWTKRFPSWKFGSLFNFFSSFYFWEEILDVGFLFFVFLLLSSLGFGRFIIFLFFLSFLFLFVFFLSFLCFLRIFLFRFFESFGGLFGRRSVGFYFLKMTQILLEVIFEFSQTLFKNLSCLNQSFPVELLFRFLLQHGSLFLELENFE